MSAPPHITVRNDPDETRCQLALIGIQVERGWCRQTQPQTPGCPPGSGCAAGALSDVQLVIGDVFQPVGMGIGVHGHRLSQVQVSGPGVVHQLGNIQTIGVGGKPLAQLVVFGKRNNLPRGRQAKLLDIIFSISKRRINRPHATPPTQRLCGGWHRCGGRPGQIAVSRYLPGHGGIGCKRRHRHPSAWPSGQ